MSIFWKRQETDQAIIYRSRLKIWYIYLTPLCLLALGFILQNFFALSAIAGICILLFFLFCLIAAIDNLSSINRDVYKVSGVGIFPKNKVSRQNVGGYGEIIIEK